ncbi:glycosyl hydrolase family 28-related protein [Streptomyces sp. L7]
MTSQHAHDSSSRRRLLATAASLGGAALAATVATAGARRPPRTPGAGWLNVKDTAYGALGDDSTDDRPAIQKAIDAAGQGGTVYFPPGKYRIASPLNLSLGVTLRGDWNPHFPVRTNMADSFIRPGIGNFTGAALIIVDPAPVNGDYTDSAYRGGPCLYGLALDGRGQKDSTGTAIDGIRINPGVKDVGMDKVTVWRFTGHGVNAQNAAAFQLNQVHCVDNDGHGFTWGDSAGTGGGLVDADLFQCYAQGNAGHGYDILNPNAVTMVDCRSEWNAQHGYRITGINYSMVLVGCNTDRNGQDGFHVSTSAGGRFVQFLGCLAKRDGKSTTGASGFTITGTSAEGVVLTGCSTTVGRDDDNGGSYSPAYGITTSALNSASCVLGHRRRVRRHDSSAVQRRRRGPRPARRRHRGHSETDSGLTWDQVRRPHGVEGAAGTVPGTCSSGPAARTAAGRCARPTRPSRARATAPTSRAGPLRRRRHSPGHTGHRHPLHRPGVLRRPGMVVNANASPGVNLLDPARPGRATPSPVPTPPPAPSSPRSPATRSTASPSRSTAPRASARAAPRAATPVGGAWARPRSAAPTRTSWRASRARASG